MLEPIILIHCYNEQGEVIKFETLPYNGDSEVLTNKLQELLSEENVFFAQPVSGYKLAKN